MIRKFSITNTSNIISTDDQTSLVNLADRSQRHHDSAAHSDKTESSVPESREHYLTSTESTDNTNRLMDMSYTEDYCTASEEDSIDEGLSMSEEDDLLSPDQKDLARILEDLDVNQKLISAAQRGQSQLVKDLLADGARVNVDQNGTTAIHQAAQNGFADVVRIFLENSNDVDTPDSGGYTALHKAAGNGHLDVLELLINEGCDIDIQDDSYGNTPLHEAAWHGFSKSVDLLLKNKSNPFIANRAGCTALHLAAQSGHNQSGRTLLYAGCSPDVKNNYGDTPLHTAARYGHAGIARILISARCSISEQNKNGDTALHIAAAFKRRKIAKLLVEAGINHHLKNKQTETAVEIARRKDHLSIIEIIHLGQSEPTGGVRLNYCSPAPTNSSQQSDKERITPDRSNQNRKKSSGLVSWIKKKFAKDKSNSKTVSNAGTTNFCDGNMGLFSQYVKRQGFAYYRDLAGNIRQGPVGFVPNCQCELKHSGMESPMAQQRHTHLHHMDDVEHILNDRLHELELRTNQQVHEMEMTTTSRLLAEKQECLDRLRRHNHQEKHSRDKQISKMEHNLKTDLQTWLVTQRPDGMEADPFAYGVGTKQQRFGDDFDHQRIARYEALQSDQFLPPPRLFRSRSDETLSHSEYSFHGRAFKSREAAMEELKTLRHHEEIKERRKKIRAGLTDGVLQSARESMQLEGENSNKINSVSKQELWKSEENLIDDTNSKTDTGCESHDATPRAPGIIRPTSIQTRELQKLVTDTSIKSYNSPSTPNTIKSPDSAPLKSAMRQPKSEQSNTSKTVKLYRSSSLPRDSTQEYTPIIIDQKKTKTVRYDETVKATEISEDSPPSHTNQSEETLLPVAQRETPIGGHDEKYSENATRTNSHYNPTYQSIAMVLDKKNTAESSQDLRDSIMSARNELLARNKSSVSDYKHSEIPMKNYMTPPSRPAELRDLKPKHNSAAIDEQKSVHSMYRSDENIRSSPKLVRASDPIPFSHYTNIPKKLDYSTNPAFQNTRADYSTSSLPRQPKGMVKSSSSHISSYGTLSKRAPLPSYDEIQSQRWKRATSQLPHYPGQTLSPSKHSPKEPVHQPDSNRLSFHDNTNNHMYQKGLDISANTGSCSSSNPDSGYGGQNFDMYSSTHSNYSTDHSWYQQSLKKAAYKINSNSNGQIPAYSHQALRHPTYNGTVHRKPPPAPPPPPTRRVVYSNMTSDV